MTDEELKQIKKAAYSRGGTAEATMAFREKARELQEAIVREDRCLFIPDGYSMKSYVVPDPATAEAVRTLLVLAYTRRADELEATLKEVPIDAR